MISVIKFSCGLFNSGAGRKRVGGMGIGIDGPQRRRIRFTCSRLNYTGRRLICSVNRICLFKGFRGCCERNIGTGNHRAGFAVPVTSVPQWPAKRMAPAKWTVRHREFSLLPLSSARSFSGQDSPTRLLPRCRGLLKV